MDTFRARAQDSEELKLAIACALNAGLFIKKHYGENHAFEWKSKQEFKTRIDDVSEAIIVSKIKEKFPNDAILAEEGSAQQGISGRLWVIDPLDGTIPYTFGISDHFSVCIALVINNNPVLGVIYAPRRNELYTAELGKGAFCDGEQIKVSSLINIERSKIGIDGIKNLNPPYSEKILKEGNFLCHISSGCASVPLCLVACGKLDIYLSPHLKPWDMAAAVPIIREAGGKVTNLAGEEWTIKDNTILAANPILHAKMIDLFK